MTPAGESLPPFDASELASRLGGELDGEDLTVERLAPPGGNCEGAIVVLANEAQLEAAPEWKPAVVVTASRHPRPPGIGAVITVTDTRLALALLTELFDDRPLPQEGVDGGAQVAGDARLGRGVRVAAGAVVSQGAVIGDFVIVGEGAFVGAGAVVGEASRLHAGAKVLDRVQVGRRVMIHAGAVIGSDGFGYAPSPQGARKLRHLGSVVIGDDVEIGANTCVDRGTLGDTRIGDRTKIDNLCQIAHNVTIGSDCLIAGQSGIAGSTTIGDRVTLAGSVGVGDHLTIGDGAVLGPRAAVLKNVPAGETWIGYPAQPYRRFARQSYLLGKLERIWRFVRQREEEAGE